MGLFENLFGRKPKVEPKGTSVFQTLTAYSPRFTSWGGQLYESELVRAAVDAKARYTAKLTYNMTGTARRKLYTVTKTAPNQWQTWSAFLERCSNIYELENNLFIVPVLDQYGEITGFYPVVPSSCEVVESLGTPFLRFSFLNGRKHAMELDRIGIVTKHQMKDDFFGERNTALDGTMRLVHMVEQGIMEGVKNSASYRFMAQLNNYAFDEDLKKERERFDKTNFQGESGGLLLFNNTMTNIKQLDQKGYTVDPEQMKLIRSNVERYFGVNEAIMTNSATSDQIDSFFTGAVEIFAIKLSEALTKMVFTQTERNNGNKITFTANRIEYMAVASKVQMAKELVDRGILMIDEIRGMFWFDPLPDGAGQHAPIRGEYYMVDEGKEGKKDGRSG